MRAKSIAVVLASPLAAAALAFSPALITQAAAETTHATASAPHAPNVKTPAQQGTTDGNKAGKKDGGNCDYHASYHPELKKDKFSKSDYTKYKSAYTKAYEKAYDDAFDQDACEED